MDRRKFLQLSSITSLYIIASTTLKASSSLKKLTFREIYPKSFWRKSYFSWVVMGVTIVVAGAVTYFSAGTGAPAAAGGVSTVASWLGGGGAGSYMAGLSTVGSVFGGNAILGAAILNGISIGTIGTGAAKLTIAAKIALFTDITLSGIAYLKNESEANGVYIFDIKLPKDVGSKPIKELVDAIYELNEKKMDALEDKKNSEAERFDREINSIYDRGVSWLEKYLNRLSLEDLTVLSIMAYKRGKLDLYKKALENIDYYYKSSLKNSSFLDYLWGIYYLSIPSDKAVDRAWDYFINSNRNENYTIEPILAIISILEKDYYNNRGTIIYWVNKAKEKFDSDEYDGRGLLGLYYKVGSTALIHQDYQTAIKYFKKAYDELGIIVKILPVAEAIKKNINLNIAICYKNLGELKKAKEYLEDAIDDCNSAQEKVELRRVYNEV